MALAQTAAIEKKFIWQCRNFVGGLLYGAAALIAGVL
jgi:hypothetical protein